MTAHLPSQDEPTLDGESDAGTSQAVASMVLAPSSEPEEPFFYFEEEPPEEMKPPYVAPFQASGTLPLVSPQAQPSGQVSVASRETPSGKKSKQKRWLSLPMIAILICVVVIAGMTMANVLTQTTPPLQAQKKRESSLKQPLRSTQQMPTMKQPSSPEQGQTENQSAQPSFDWVPQQLPGGWINAGLTVGDDLEAIRTAVSFNDREMSLDYRSVGTRDHHGGTFTAATFILTPAAQQRFAQNDVRLINNTLFDTVARTRMVRMVINPQPALIQFATQGQQQFAWVDVSFQLWISQLDPNNPRQRIEGKEMDPTTNQPRVHHMLVLLLRVPPETAGANPAMGGTGWLVSTYALDLPKGTRPDIIQPA